MDNPRPTKPTERHRPVSADTNVIDITPIKAVLERATPSVPDTESTRAWDADLLDRIEAHFVRFIGPIAKVVVRREAKRTADLDELYAALADKLDAAERAVFLAGRNAPSEPASTLSTQAPSPVAEEPATRSTEALTPQQIELAERRFAAYIGPIAKIIVKKAAAKAGSPQEFYQLLADRLDSETDRAQFLSQSRN